MGLLTVPNCHSCQGKSRQQRLHRQLHTGVVVLFFSTDTDEHLSIIGRKTWKMMQWSKATGRKFSAWLPLISTSYLLKIN